ncbi:MAG: plasma-membrane proton-efflux P-type ATPase [Syntrophobacterales bacterium]
MTIDQVKSDEAQHQSAEELYETLGTNRQGLSNDQAQERLSQFGPNALEEKKLNPILKFLSYFWGPIPWMIEVAAILSAIVRHWDDLIIILVLLVFNAAVGFWQEFKAANALEALKRQLALMARALRDGEWQQIPAAQLVPGDIVRLHLGEIIPADVKLIEGDFLSVDQSALTGESLPVGKEVGDVAYSGSVAKQGEMVALVTSTGTHTSFGRTARLVQTAGSVSHFQKAVLHIGDYLIYLSLALVSILILVQLERGDKIITLIQFALILTVASIPVAMPAVLSVTMAIGAQVLSKMKAIVTRLESIEEMAGIDILCSDKTGTLTQNKLTLGEPVAFEAGDPQELILYGSLASKEDDQDPIDLAVLGGLEDKEKLHNYKVIKFLPFDPVGKRTEATLEDPQHKTLRVTKGAPQVVMNLCDLCHVDTEAAKRADHIVDDLAAKGYRTLGVARAEDNGPWQFLGILPLFDPPREDSATTIADAQAHIVKALQSKGHLVGMTGDGVNDAPAIKQADMGIAVSGATDAARAAADLVLAAPGLSVIVNAVEEARRIFERMNSYAIYRIVETIRIMFFVVLAMIIYGFYPITAIMIILLAFFNDIPIMAIAFDHTLVDPDPVRWNMRRILTVSTVLGLIGVGETFLILIIAKKWLMFDIPEIQTFIFLKLAVAGHLTLFVARTPRMFLRKPYPAPVLLWSAIFTKVLATLFVIYPLGLITPISWKAAGIIWGYCLVWIFIEDLAKLEVYRHMALASPRHTGFLQFFKKRLSPYT